MTMREKLDKLHIKTNNDLKQWADRTRDQTKECRYSFFVRQFGQDSADKLMSRMAQIECDIFATR